MNLIQLLIFLNSVIVLGLSGFVFKLNPGDRLNRAFLRTGIVLGAYSFSRFMIMQAGSFSSAEFWLKVHAFAPFVAPVFLQFALEFTNRGARLRRWPGALILYFPVFAVAVADAGWGILYNGVVPESWGYVPRPQLSSPLFWFCVASVYAQGLAAIGLYLFYWRTASDAREKAKARVVLVGFLVPTAANLAYVAVLPALGFNVPDLSTLTLGWLFAFVAYAIWRYRLFAMDPETAERRFQAIAQSVREAIISADDRGHIIYWNAGARSMFGFEEVEMLGRPLTAIMPGHYREKHREGMARYLAGGAPVAVGKTVELAGLRKDGAEFPAEISLSAWNAAGKTFFSAVIRDITRRKRAEEALTKKNREILDFADTVTHDLKKPLSVVKTLQSFFDTGALGTLNDNGREALAQSKAAVNFMQTMLDDLLACARMESGAQAFQPEPLDCRTLVGELLEHFKLQIAEKKVSVTLQLDGAGRVRADRKALIQVFMNLLGNAFNYLGEGEGRAVGVGAEPVNGYLKFFVRDNGLGIPAEDQAAIFSKFKRGGNVSGISGTGLGLAIVKAAVEAHGGKIWLESKQGEGTVFYFTLPAWESP